MVLVSLGACSQKVQLFELWSTSCCRRPSHLSTLRTKPDLQFDQDIVNIIYAYTDTHIYILRASFVTAHDLPCFREDILLERFLNSEPVSTWFGIRTWSAVPLWEGLKSVSRSRSRSRSRRSRRSRRSSYSCSCSYGESLVCFHCVKLFFNLQKVVILSWQFHSEAFSCIPYLIASQWKPKSLRGMFGTTLQ